MAKQTDSITKKVSLRAPRDRVWKALTDWKQFGQWFQVELAGPFVPGKATRGRLLFEGMEHVEFDFIVEAIEPKTRFSYRWHPYAVDPKTDYSKEPTTLIVFTLEDSPEGTLLTVVESGFDKLPAHRRDEAFRMNDGGWAEQLGAIEKYVSAR